MPLRKQPTPTRKPRTQSKLDDTYGKALEQFTEVLRNKNDMYDAWNKIGFIHLHFGAYRESIDDYNHALALKPDLLEAIEHRGEAYMGVDHLDEAKAAYMDLFFHARPLADQLMITMQSWLQSHRAAANGMRAGGYRCLRQMAAGARGHRQDHGLRTSLGTSSSVGCQGCDRALRLA